MTDSHGQERRIVHYSGRVQGVGFRYTTCRVAGGFAVTGNVRNLPDGRVQVVAEGDAAAIQGFLRALATEMAGHITSVRTDTRPATGEFHGFHVEH